MGLISKVHNGFPFPHRGHSKHFPWRRLCFWEAIRSTASGFTSTSIATYSLSAAYRCLAGLYARRRARRLGRRRTRRRRQPTTPAVRRAWRSRPSSRGGTTLSTGNGRRKSRKSSGTSSLSFCSPRTFFIPKCMCFSSSHFLSIFSFWLLFFSWFLIVDNVNFFFLEICLLNKGNDSAIANWNRSKYIKLMVVYISLFSLTINVDLLL